MYADDDDDELSDLEEEDEESVEESGVQNVPPISSPEQATRVSKQSAEPTAVDDSLVELVPPVSSFEEETIADDDGPRYSKQSIKPAPVEETTGHKISHISTAEEAAEVLGDAEVPRDSKQSKLSSSVEESSVLKVSQVSSADEAKDDSDAARESQLSISPVPSEESIKTRVSPASSYESVRPPASTLPVEVPVLPPTVRGSKAEVGAIAPPPSRASKTSAGSQKLAAEMGKGKIDPGRRSSELSVVLTAHRDSKTSGLVESEVPEEIEEPSLLPSVPILPGAGLPGLPPESTDVSKGPSTEMTPEERLDRVEKRIDKFHETVSALNKTYKTSLNQTTLNKG